MRKSYRRRCDDCGNMTYHIKSIVNGVRYICLSCAGVMRIKPSGMTDGQFAKAVAEGMEDE